MREAMLPLLLGFLLGLRHAFEPDHLAAVAALMGSGKHQRRPGAGRVGALWGAGHAAALLLAGSMVILLGWRIPPRLQSGMELAVAAILILLGGRILMRVLRKDRAHLHLHEHDGLRHAHLHFHAREEEGHATHHHHLLPALTGARRRPFLVGMLHGLSGTGAATLLVLAASPTPMTALIGLALFGSGAMAGMAALSWILGMPLLAAERRSRALYWGLQVASGLVSVLVGIGLAGRMLHVL